MIDQETKQYIENELLNQLHDGNKAQRINEYDLFGRIRYVLYRAVSSATALTTGTTVGGDFVWPFSGTLLEVGATVDTAGSTGTMEIDINKNGTTVLSTKITIDTTEKTSRTAAVPSMVSDTNFKVGDIFTFDIDTVQGTPASGLTIYMDVSPS